MKFTFIPQQVCLVLAGVFGGVAFVAQCAVQDTAIIKEAIADPLSLVDNLATISSQVSQLHAAVTSQTPASLQDIRAVIADTVPAAAPVVNVAEAAGAATVVQITPQNAAGGAGCCAGYITGIYRTTGTGSIITKPIKH